MIATHLRLVLQAIRLDAHRLVARRLLGAPAGPSAASTTAPASALRYLPVAGLLAGLLFSILYVLFAQLLPHSVAVVLAMALTTWSAGGTHELGWAGLVDELALRRRAGTRRLPMRAAGTLALVLLIVVKVEVLSSLDPNWISIAVVAAASLSRGLAVAVTASLPVPVQTGEAAAPALPHPGAADGVVAMILGALPAAAAAWWFDYPDAFGCALVPALAVAGWLRVQQRRRLGGGGTHAVHGLQQAIEVAFLIGLLAWWTLGAPAVEPPIDPDSAND